MTQPPAPIGVEPEVVIRHLGLELLRAHHELAIARAAIEMVQTQTEQDRLARVAAATNDETDE